MGFQASSFIIFLKDIKKKSKREKYVLSFVDEAIFLWPLPYLMLSDQQSCCLEIYVHLHLLIRKVAFLKNK